MDAYLNVTTKILAYGDRTINSNPRLRHVDWLRDNSGISVANPKSEAHSLAAGETKTIFSGTRTTTLDGTSAFSVALSTYDSNRYRITWTGGTNPTFRTGRNLTLNGIAVTFAVQADNSVTVTVPGLAAFDFTGVVAGDTVFIPHTTTGDAANVLSVLNAGNWTVLAVPNSKTLSLVRPTGEDFVATSETATLTANSQFVAFSGAGVQAGDYVDLGSGFAAANQKTFAVAAVTATWVEVESTSPLAPETGITPGAAGLVFYSSGKSFLYLEADQEIVIRLNGATDNTQRLSPIEAGNADKPGDYMKRGPVWALVVVNRSSVPANVLVIHGE